MALNLYLLSRPEGNVAGWEEYISAVVAAKSSVDAVTIHPSSGAMSGKVIHATEAHGWILPEEVVVQYIGKAARGIKRGVVLASNKGA